ncbi:MAG: hypothetical protein GYA57_13085 [Myxococcales bacterium]|nr:hypothetical protein [Myxococcales bacterium]
MSGVAIAFMLLTMGGVLALNALCIGLWLRRGKAPPAPPDSTPPAAPPGGPPAS